MSYSLDDLESDIFKVRYCMDEKPVDYRHERLADVVADLISLLKEERTKEEDEGRL